MVAASCRLLVLGEWVFVLAPSHRSPRSPLGELEEVEYTEEAGDGRGIIAGAAWR